MQYNTPNYRLIGSYIDHKVSSQQTPPEEARFDKEIAQQLHFDRNNLQGQRNELHDTISGIMSQLDYDMPAAEKYTPPAQWFNRGTKEDPQDMLNNKTYKTLHREDSPNHPNNGSANDYYNDNIQGQGSGSEYTAPRRPFKPTVNPYIPFGPHADSHVNPYAKSRINPYIRPPFHERLYHEWSLMRTVVLVIVLLAIFYLLLNVIVQRRRCYKARPDEGNMNPPGVRLAEAPLVSDTD